MALREVPLIKAEVALREVPLSKAEVALWEVRKVEVALREVPLSKAEVVKRADTTLIYNGPRWPFGRCR